jgi:hypothetical protein
MSSRVLERRWMARINEARQALGGSALSCLPRGTRREPADCVQHRAMRDLGLGHFEVMSNQLVVDEEFAGIIAEAWGTEVVTTKHGTGPLLPAEAVDAIAEFDRKRSLLSHLHAV